MDPHTGTIYTEQQYNEMQESKLKSELVRVSDWPGETVQFVSDAIKEKNKRARKAARKARRKNRG